MHRFSKDVANEVRRWMREMLCLIGKEAHSNAVAERTRASSRSLIATSSARVRSATASLARSSSSSRARDRARFVALAEGGVAVGGGARRAISRVFELATHRRRRRVRVVLAATQAMQRVLRGADGVSALFLELEAVREPRVRVSSRLLELRLREG